MTRKKRSTKNFRRSPQARKIDPVLLIVIALLLTIGVVMVYEASVIEAFELFSDKAYFAKLQGKWAILGVLSMAVSTIIPIKSLQKLALPLFAAAIIMLVMVLIPGFGTTAQGAKRWISLGSFSFQPSEFTKLALVIYFSAIFREATKITILLSSLAAIIFLVMLQPDLGTTIVISTVAITIYYAAQAPISHILAITFTGLATVLGLIASSQYRRQRLFTFLDPSRDPLGASYHIRQILIALGSGGLLGTGIGRSLQKFQYLPEATSDSIFAVIAEETGFIGVIFVIALFVIFTHKGLSLAQNLPDKFMSLLATGLTTLISFQALLNLSAMSALVPLTGVTLPFISYGGSSLVITLTASGLLLNLSRYSNK